LGGGRRVTRLQKVFSPVITTVIYQYDWPEQSIIDIDFDYDFSIRIAVVSSSKS